MIFDMKKREITIWLFFKNQPIKFPLSDLRSMLVNIAVHFVLKDGRVYGCPAFQDDFFSFLELYKIDIEWGRIGQMRRK
ncbi:hypothetical protein [Desulfatibacillum aliphaticivorans]|uniref:hypothetical protein n=1 Tax=Desulfatibacillum aliphaticivorans TaxID=218208 RepID=UPI0012F72F5C|nr:hypothetical protein [Desulfatibacillum aliphaticivorans]